MDRGVLLHFCTISRDKLFLAHAVLSVKARLRPDTEQR